MVEVPTQKIRTHKKLEVDYAVDHNRVGHITQEVNNHKTAKLHKSNVTSAADNSESSIIWRIGMTNNMKIFRNRKPYNR